MHCCWLLLGVDANWAVGDSPKAVGTILLLVICPPRTQQDGSLGCAGVTTKNLGRAKRAFVCFRAPNQAIHKDQQKNVDVLERATCTSSH